ncbi:MAG: hypothetical protein ACXVXA_18485 [Nocardioidaceae bacterium]
MSSQDFEGFQSPHIVSFAPDRGWLAEVRWEDGTSGQVPMIGWAIVHTSIEPVLLLDDRRPAVLADLEAIGAELVRLTARETVFGGQ